MKNSHVIRHGGFVSKKQINLKNSYSFVCFGTFGSSITVRSLKGGDINVEAESSLSCRLH